MNMKITCPECTERFDVSSDMIGRKAKCGECAHVFIVPDLVDKKAKKEKNKESGDQAVDVRQTAWLSLYLAGLAVALEITVGQQAMMTSIPVIIMSFAMGIASTFLVWRAFWSVWPLRHQDQETHLVKTAIIVNGIMLALTAFSILILIIALIAGVRGSNDLGGLGSGLGDMMKNMNEINKLLPKN
ncbi:MAG TPA: zinc-ribbon domain-containing protein [Gemmatales bacterium]|nr:zinc-ribbon domain-containing protein [Gemmatales bacterium]